MTKKTLPIGSIKPYAGNPRKIPKAAVDAVVESIKQFGYNVPILVDEDNVILTGHTRLLALKELGYTKVTVLVLSGLPPKKAREFRVIDNRISEMSEWDDDLLRDELRAVAGSGEMDAFFNSGELDRLMGRLDEVPDSKTPTQAEINQTKAKNEAHYQNKADEVENSMVQIACRHCGEKFFIDGRLAD